MRRSIRAVLLSVPILVGPACFDDSLVKPFESVDTEPTDTGTASSTGLASTTTGAPATTDATSGGLDPSTTTGHGTSTGGDSGGDASTGDDSTGGDPLTNQTVAQLVSVGQRAASSSYTVVYTFGQPSPLQSTHQSANYRVRGGLIGANGSPP
jgi:hypothetical protein